jgi:hypothetical protein
VRRLSNGSSTGSAAAAAGGGVCGSPVISGISMGQGIGIGAGSSGISSIGQGQPAAAAAAAAAAAGGPQQQQQLVPGLSHIAAALPLRFQSRDWQLLYSTARHGISLQTL